MASLAEILYAEFRRTAHDPTALPAWGNLPSEERAQWDAVERKATEPVTLPPADVVAIDMDVTIVWRS